MIIKISEDEMILFEGFIEESLELLEGIEEKILAMEAEFSVEYVNDIFRAVHTIKGTSSFLGLTPVKNLSHELEFLLDDLRKGKREIDPDIVNVLLDGTDFLRNMILKLKDQLSSGSDELEVDEVDNIIAMVKEVRERKGKVVSDKKEETKKEEREEVKVEEKVESEEVDEFNYESPKSFKALKNAEIQKDMYNQYREEMEEHLQNIEENLLQLEDNPNDTEAINEVFRSLHSIKGNSGLLLSLINQDSYEGLLLKAVQKVSHKAESSLQKVRDGEEKLSRGLIDAIFKVLDYLKLLFTRYIVREEKQPFPNPTTVISLLNASFETKEEQAQVSEESKVESPLKDAISQYLEVAASIVDIWESQRAFTVKEISTYKRALNLLSKSLKKFEITELDSNIKSQEDALELLEAGKLSLKDDVIIELFREKIKEIEVFRDTFEEFKVKRVGEILVEKGKIRENDLKEALATQEKQAVIASKLQQSVSQKTSVSIQTIRVRMEKLDKLMSLIGEIVISKNSFYHIYKKLVERNITDIAKEFKENMIMKIGRLANELQDTIVQVRMIPVKTVFQKFPRMVRDLAMKNGKKIKLVMEGEETELDKTVIEQINDPLVHIIRNSCDHGIEPPEERRAAGKPEEGTILLKAENRGNFVIIEITDDGRGIDEEKVKKKAIEKGLITEEQAAEMSKEEAINLIFMPGFSTADKVTEVSGRGVGMDVVKTNITKLKGSISIHSEKGMGTTITIKLPLTLAITKGLNVRIGSKNFILPLENVDEIIKLKLNSITNYRGKELADVRGEVIELLDLKKAYNLDGKGVYEGVEEGELNVVLINSSGIKIGLKVDALEDQLDMVVKPLPEYLSSIPGVSGGTILGDGRVAIVLDPMGLIDLL